MEPDIDRVRRKLGIALLIFVFAGILGGVALLGRIVGDAVGTAYVGEVPSAEGLAYPEKKSKSEETQNLPPGVEPMPPLAAPNALPTPAGQRKRAKGS
jgi:hypothetical protein